MEDEKSEQISEEICFLLNGGLAKKEEEEEGHPICQEICMMENKCGQLSFPNITTVE